MKGSNWVKALCLGLGLLVSAVATADVSGTAPDFTLKSRDGDNLRLEDLRGEVIMLNFWASWCGPCRQEMPHMDAIEKEFRDYGFRVLAVNVDQHREDAERFLDAVPVDFAILWDHDSTVSERYDVQAMPTTVMIDRDGKARYVHHGYQPGYEDDYRDQIRELIRE
ncbi:TlpA family protein disulfide reductase [Marinobacter lacisalsi]|uniref:TlpA family protein disulfide reductase n=1 Tax=Marinobacter lacisalsi TaxID=475979 RepID=A0ABV8QFR6_9GAMM